MSRWRSMVLPALLVVVRVVVGHIIVGFVGAIDWGAVASAFPRLSAWQLVPLLAVLLVRQVLNGVPLSQFVPGLTLIRSVQKVLAANLLGTVTPPPGDVVIRVAMNKSWG